MKIALDISSVERLIRCRAVLVAVHALEATDMFHLSFPRPPLPVRNEYWTDEPAPTLQDSTHTSPLTRVGRAIRRRSTQLEPVPFGVLASGLSSSPDAVVL